MFHLQEVYVQTTKYFQIYFLFVLKSQGLKFNFNLAFLKSSLSKERNIRLVLPYIGDLIILFISLLRFQLAAFSTWLLLPTLLLGNKWVL